MTNLSICKSCGSKCCKSTPPALTSIDIMRIKAITGTEVWLKEKNGVYVIGKKPNSNDCFFLDEDGRCTIYENRPLDCQLFPLFVKILNEDSEYVEVEWRIWYCPLTNALSLEKLLEGARKIVLPLLRRNINELLEYQVALKRSGGYKKKHFLMREKIRLNTSNETI